MECLNDCRTVDDVWTVIIVVCDDHWKFSAVNELIGFVTRAGDGIMVWARIPVCSDDMGMRPQSQIAADWVECCRWTSIFHLTSLLPLSLSPLSLYCSNKSHTPISVHFVLHQVVTKIVCPFSAPQFMSSCDDHMQVMWHSIHLCHASALLLYTWNILWSQVLESQPELTDSAATMDYKHQWIYIHNGGQRYGVMGII